jgi:hypothetical protein
VAAQGPRRVIAVLGMHRSGTSCLTGSLEGAGLGLGEVHTWNRYNRRGNRENQAIVDLNDAVLEANGGSWESPPQRVTWTEEQRDRARALIAAIDGGGPVGFKDPRTLLTLDGWLEALPQLEFVGVFRRPLAVARSLEQRSGMPLNAALALWEHYNRRLLRLHSRHDFPLVDFDISEAQYLRRVAVLAETLGLDAQAALREPFFSEDLRTAHQHAADRTLPYRVSLLHWRLRRRSARQARSRRP